MEVTHAIDVSPTSSAQALPRLSRFAAGRPENLPFAKLLLDHRLQQPDGIETDLGTAFGKLRQNETTAQH